MMILKLRKNVDFFIYALGSLGSAAIPFLLLPLITRYLSTSEYGNLSLYTLTYSIVVILIGMGTNSAASRGYFTSNEPEKVLGSCILIVSCSFSFVLLITVLMDVLLLSEWPFDRVFIYLGVLSAYFQVIVNFRLSQWQVRKKPTFFAFLQIAFSFVNVTFSVLFVVYFGLKSDGRILAIIVATIMVGLYSFFSLYKNEVVDFVGIQKNVISSLRFGVPLIPFLLLNGLAITIDRLLINNFLGSSELGVYAVVAQISSLVSIFFVSLGNALHPRIMHSLKTNESNVMSTLRWHLWRYILAVLAMYCIFYFILPVIFSYAIASSFQSGKLLVPIVSSGFFLAGITSFLSILLIFKGKTLLLSIILFSVTAIHIVVSFFWVSFYGLEGIAISFLITRGLYFILVVCATIFIYRESV